MQRINWEMSRDKWVPIVALLEKPGKVDWEKIGDLACVPCGHCAEYPSCKGCSLNYPKLCGHDLKKSSYRDFRQLWSPVRRGIPRNKRRALSIARRILKAILKDEPGGERG